MSLEYSISWESERNASFHGSSDWMPWDDENATDQNIYDELSDGGLIPEGLQQAIEFSGFGWNVEVRDA